MTIIGEFLYKQILEGDTRVMIQRVVVSGEPLPFEFYGNSTVTLPDGRTVSFNFPLKVQPAEGAELGERVAQAYVAWDRCVRDAREGIIADYVKQKAAHDAEKAAAEKAGSALDAALGGVPPKQLVIPGKSDNFVPATEGERHVPKDGEVKRLFTR